MAWDPVWEKVFKDQEWGKYPPEGLIRFIARNFYARDRTKVKILEVGCGPGANIWYMAREGFAVSGLDGSQAAIDRAKRRMEAEKLTADLRVGDIVYLPYKNAEFDAVVDLGCLEHNSRADTEKILTEIARVLKQDGLLYSRTVAGDSYIGAHRENIGALEYNNISDGPLAGKGFVRLADKDLINKIYGQWFDVVSVDTIAYTFDNENMKISKWDIVCKKKALGIT